MQLIDYIEVLDDLGAGGVASVKLGVDRHTGFPVAIKTLHQSLFKNELIKEKFIREANHYVYLKHENIVKLKNLIIKDDAIYLIMEYIEGDTLEHYINNISGRIPQEIAIPMMLDVLSALDFAHSRNIVHLDIKPSNIMITKEGDIKVLDFGISSDLTQEMANHGMGTPFYMSPEQIDGKNVDHRSDIFSLGVTFFQMLTAKLPFPTENKEQLFNHIKYKKFDRLSKYLVRNEQALQNVFEKATEKNPFERIRSCKQFSEELNLIPCNWLKLADPMKMILF